MTRVHANLTIKKPVEQVYAFAWEVKNLRKWQPESIESVILSPELGQPGSQIHSKVSGWGSLTLEVDQVTTEVMPNQVYAVETREVHGWVKALSLWKFEAVAAGTLVSASHEIELNGWLGLAKPMFLNMAQRKVEDDLARLKAFLEVN